MKYKLMTIIGIAGSAAASVFGGWDRLMGNAYAGDAVFKEIIRNNTKQEKYFAFHTKML